MIFFQSGKITPSVQDKKIERIKKSIIFYAKSEKHSMLMIM